MSEQLSDVFKAALRGPNDKAIALQHRWFSVFAQNHDGHAALVLRVGLEPDEAIADGRGFEVKTERGGTDDYVRFTAEAEGTPLVFLKLVETILETTNETKSKADAVAAIAIAVDEFRGFFGRRRNRLSDSEVRGVFAELVFMKALLDRGQEPAVAVSAWHGPFALEGVGNHDFVFLDGSSVEIKSTRTGVKQVMVSSAIQLTPSGSELYLAVLPVEDVAEGPTFRTYARELDHVMATSSPAAAGAWQDALAALGLDLDDEWYDRFRLAASSWVCFSVGLGFPHIDLANIPPGIARVAYALELAYLTPFVVSFQSLLGRIIS